MQVRLWDKKGFPLPSPKAERKWRGEMHSSPFPAALTAAKDRAWNSLLQQDLHLQIDTPRVWTSHGEILEAASIASCLLVNILKACEHSQLRANRTSVWLCQISQVQPSHPCLLQETEQAVVWSDDRGMRSFTRISVHPRTFTERPS